MGMGTKWVGIKWGSYNPEKSPKVENWAQKWTLKFSAKKVPV